MQKRTGMISTKKKWLAAIIVSLSIGCFSHPRPGTMEEALQENAMLRQENTFLLEKLYECLQKGEDLRRNCNGV